ATPSRVLSARRVLFVLAAAAAAAAVAAAPAAASSYSLEKADVSVRIQKNGALSVTERLQVFFFGQFTYGYRDIPTREGESIDHITVASEDILGNVTRYRGGGSAEKKSNLTPNTFGVEQSSDKTTIVWHFAPASGSQTYIIGYRFRGLAQAYSDVVDVNMKVWGDQWQASLHHLTPGPGPPPPRPAP